MGVSCQHAPRLKTCSLTPWTYDPFSHIVSDRSLGKKALGRGRGRLQGRRGCKRWWDTSPGRPPDVARLHLEHLRYVSPRLKRWYLRTNKTFKSAPSLYLPRIHAFHNYITVSITFNETHAETLGSLTNRSGVHTIGVLSSVLTRINDNRAENIWNRGFRDGVYNPWTGLIGIDNSWMADINAWPLYVRPSVLAPPCLIFPTCVWKKLEMTLVVFIINCCPLTPRYLRDFFLLPSEVSMKFTPIWPSRVIRMVGTSFAAFMLCFQSDGWWYPSPLNPSKYPPISLAFLRREFKRELRIDIRSVGIIHDWSLHNFKSIDLCALISSRKRKPRVVKKETRSRCVSQPTDGTRCVTCSRNIYSR